MPTPSKFQIAYNEMLISIFFTKFTQNQSV